MHRHGERLDKDSMFVWDPSRDRDHVRGGNDEQLAESARALPAIELHRLTQLRLSSPTMQASSAADGRKDAGKVADCQGPLRPRPERLDCPIRLVTHDKRRPQERMLARVYLEIGAADPAACDPDTHRLTAGRRSGLTADLEAIRRRQESDAPVHPTPILRNLISPIE